MRDQADISTAIRECLDSLRPGWSPIAHLAAFREGLRCGGWLEQDIIAVDSAVRHILVRVVDSRQEEQMPLKRPC